MTRKTLVGIDSHVKLLMSNFVVMIKKKHTSNRENRPLRFICKLFCLAFWQIFTGPGFYASVNWNPNPAGPAEAWVIWHRPWLKKGIKTSFPWGGNLYPWQPKFELSLEWNKLKHLLCLVWDFYLLFANLIDFWVSSWDLSLLQFFYRGCEIFLPLGVCIKVNFLCWTFEFILLLVYLYV